MSTMQGARAGRRTIAWLVVLIAATVVVGACESEGGGSGPAATTRPTIGRPAPDPGCTAEFANRLLVTTDIAAEVPYLSQIDACTNSAGSMTYLNNRSDAAWTLRAVTTSTAVVDQLVGLDEWQQVLRSAQSKAAGTEIMAPHSSVLVRARPELVEWSLAAGNTTGWSIAAGMVDFLAEQATKEADELIGSSPRLKAIVTCALAAKDIVGADFERIGTADPVDSLLIALGLAGGLTSCGRDWLAADEAAVTKYARTVEWEELPSMTRRAQFVTSLDEAINTAKRFLGLVIELR